MAVKSKIAALVASQMGNIEGAIEARIQSEALKMLIKFANECPLKEELAEIIKVRNSLLKVINSYKKVGDKFGAIAKKLDPAIKGANAVIKLLESVPLPTAIGTPPGTSGGLISALPLGKVTKVSGNLRKISKLLEALQDDVSSIKDLVNSVGPTVNKVTDLLTTLDRYIEPCIEEINDQENRNGNTGESSNGDSISEFEGLIQPYNETLNTLQLDSVNSEFNYKGANGKKYKLSVVQEINGPGPIQRRFAIAKDNIGTVVMKGPPSFSSDTDVLLDEIKFRIDNQLP
jgi:hypothetical protein